MDSHLDLCSLRLEVSSTHLELDFRSRNILPLNSFSLTERLGV